MNWRDALIHEDIWEVLGGSCVRPSNMDRCVAGRDVEVVPDECEVSSDRIRDGIGDPDVVAEAPATFAKFGIVDVVFPISGIIAAVAEDHVYCSVGLGCKPREELVAGGAIVVDPGWGVPSLSPVS